LLNRTNLAKTAKYIENCRSALTDLSGLF
jgi:hypothetical protein